MHAQPNISRSTDNQAMKSSEFVEYDLKNIFIEKLYTTFGGGVFFFIKNQN